MREDLLVKRAINGLVSDMIERVLVNWLSFISRQTFLKQKQIFLGSLEKWTCFKIK